MLHIPTRALKMVLFIHKVEMQSERTVSCSINIDITVKFDLSINLVLMSKHKDKKINLNHFENMIIIDGSINLALMKKKLLTFLQNS